MIKRAALSSTLAVLCLSLTAPLRADVWLGDDTASFQCDDQRTKGWNFYCDPPKNAVQPEEPAEKPDVPSSPPPAPQSYTEQMMEYRAHVEELKHRAILDPTPENLLAYMEIQQQVMRRAGKFTEVWQRTMFSTPSLDPNVRKPLSNMGNNIHQDTKRAERVRAFQDAAHSQVLMFVVETPDVCLYCNAQAQVLNSLIEQHNVPVFAVTKDRTVTPEFPEATLDQGQLETFGLSETPTPFLALVDPRAGKVDLIGAGLMTQDVILHRVRVITAVPEGQLYD